MQQVLIAARLGGPLLGNTVIFHSRSHQQFLPEMNPPRYGNVRDTRVLLSKKQDLFLHMMSCFFNRYGKDPRVVKMWPKLLAVDPNQKAQEDRTWVLDFTPTTLADEVWRLIGIIKKVEFFRLIKKFSRGMVE